jgi:hypothetical protein
MTTTHSTSDGSSDLLRRSVLAVLAIVVGLVAIWLSCDYTRFLGNRGVAIQALDIRALALLYGPGIAGAGLLIAALLLLMRRRFSLGVYWGAVLVAVTVEVLSRFGCLNLSSAPGGAMQVVFTSPDFDESNLWHMGEVSLLGLLIVMGYSLTTPREREGEPYVANAGSGSLEAEI